MRPIRIIKLVYFNGPGPQRKRRHFTFSSQVERCVCSSAHPSEGAASVTFVKRLVCIEIWHQSHCETNTPIPPGLSWRSWGVATFPLPLWASQSSKDPSGHQGSSAWELEPGQISSLMKSQQEVELIKHLVTTHGETLTETSASLAFLVPSEQTWEGAMMPKVGTLCVWVHWQRGVWQSVTLSVTLGLRVGAMGARGVGRYRVHTHAHNIEKGGTAGRATSPTEPDDNTQHIVHTVSWLWISHSVISPAEQMHEPLLAHCLCTFMIQLCTKRPAHKVDTWFISSRLFTQVGFLSTCGGTFTVEQCCPFSHSAHSPLLSLTMHSAGDGICGLPCIVPRRGREVAAASHTRQARATRMKSVCQCALR